MLNGNNLYMRPFEIDQWKILYDWFYSGNYDEFFRDMAGTLTAQQFQSFANMPEGQTLLVYQKDQVIGMVMVYDCKPYTSLCKLAILLDKDYQDKSLSSEMVELILQYLHVDMGWYKVVMEVLEDNEKYNSILRTNGFVEECKLLGEALIYGKRKDVIRYYTTSDRIHQMLKERNVIWENQSPCQ